MDRARLDLLYAQLRDAGMPVDISARLRVELVLDQAGATDRDAVHGLLTTLLVQRPTDAAQFDAIFAEWWILATPTAVVDAPILEANASPAEPGRSRTPWWLLALAVAVCAVPVAQREPPKVIPEIQPIPTDWFDDEPANEGDGQLQLAESYQGWAAEVVPGEPVSDRGWDLALVLLALGTLGYCRRAFNKRHPLDEPAVTSGDDVPPPAPLPVPRLDPETPRFIAGDDRNALIWGIDRFTSGEPRRDIDVDASIAATLDNGGAATLVHAFERHHRIAWLWTDDTARKRWPELVDSANEIAAALRRVGLTVEIARFGGAPLRLRGEDNAVFTPEQVAERRFASRVVILTDGDVLRRRTQHTNGATVRRILRELARWPALVFADFARGDKGLPVVLRDYDLECIHPEEIPLWLGGERGARPPTFDDLGLWAAACALSPDPVSRHDAHLLREALAEVGLAAPPWGISRLPGARSGAGRRLTWAPPEASSAINWLYRAETGPKSLFAIARRWWTDRFAPEAGMSTTDAQHREAHRALLDLWDPERVAAAAETLFRLREVLTDTQRTRLGWCCPQDHVPDGAEPVLLPWRWDGLQPETRAQLRTVGLGAEFLDFEAHDLRRASQLWAAVGLATGMLIVGLAGLLFGEVRPATGAPECPDPLPADAICSVGNGVMIMGDRRGAAFLPIMDGSVINLKRAEARCRQTLADGSEIWRCGTNPNPVRPTDERWPRRSIGYVPKADLSEADAAALLDAGAFDILVRAGADQDAIRDALGPLAETDQILQFGDTFLYDGIETDVRRGWWQSVPDELAQRSSAVMPTTEAFDVDHMVGGQPVFLAPGTGCTPLTRTFDGIEYVRVCAGTFRMGSESGEDNERPMRELTMKAFWIGKYEVTNAQYRARIKTDHQAKEDPKWPVSWVYWHEAKAFCDKVGARLPTEAEWEYAARGSNERTYPWGNAEPTNALAVFNQNKPETVGSRPKGVGPFGTHDQAGNVREWIADCYVGRYDETVSKHPFVDKPDCGIRVLRGGAFNSSAGRLRSAIRDRNKTSFRGPKFGFRCVHGPRPER